MSANSLVKRDFLPASFNDFFRPWNEWFENGGNLWGGTLSAPAVNVVENTKDFRISVAAPGLKREDFRIETDDNMLTISAESTEEKEEKDKTYTRKEYNFSSFSRSFTLPEGVNKEKIEASYENGILNLVLPKSEPGKKQTAKRIAVK
jgi:HSP20 family protein